MTLPEALQAANRAFAFHFLVPFYQAPDSHSNRAIFIGLDPDQKHNRIADYLERADAMADRLENMLAERGMTADKICAKKRKGKR